MTFNDILEEAAKKIQNCTLGRSLALSQIEAKKLAEIAIKEYMGYRGLEE